MSQGKALAILGTMSSVGKSLLTAIVGYHLSQKGLKVSPFKAQNMSLNAFATSEGEMAFAQAFQAWACGQRPSVRMNPLLLKPMGHMISELIFMGKSKGLLPTKTFKSYKSTYKEKIFALFQELLKENDWVVVEGAGGLAELNLLPDDFVNYELTKHFQIPFILVGDIDRGGIFAQIWGTYELVSSLKALSLGFVVNKFRGDPSLFEEGISILEQKTSKPCLGLITYFSETLFEEDSASFRFKRASSSGEGLRIAVVYYPHISNYLDFDPLNLQEGVEVLLTDHPQDLEVAHAIILPGSKNTRASLAYLHEKGLAAKIRSLVGKKVILGLCGGFQLLGQTIVDQGVEFRGEVAGLGLLPHTTYFYPVKRACSQELYLDWPFYQGKVSGFEIRYGRSFLADKEVFALCRNMVFGTYLHGLFYQDDFRHAFLSFLARHFGLPAPLYTHFSHCLAHKLASICAQSSVAQFLGKLDRVLNLD